MKRKEFFGMAIATPLAVLFGKKDEKMKIFRTKIKHFDVITIKINPIKKTYIFRHNTITDDVEIIGSFPGAKTPISF